MKTVSYLSVMLAFLIPVSGCATITGGTTQDVTINSAPSGAKVTIDGKFQYMTPAAVSLSRKEDHVVTVEKDGYKTVSIPLQRNYRGMADIGGNILWLLPGIIVDAVSGGMYEFKESNLQVTLEAISPPITNASPSSTQPASAPVVTSTPSQQTK